MWEYEKDGAQSVKKPLLIIIKGHYNDKFLWLTLPEIDYLCDQWNRPPDHKDENRETEVSQGFRFFVSGWGEMKKIT